MTKSIGRWAAILLLAAAAIPLSASAQAPVKKPAATAPAKPVAKPAPAAHAPTPHLAPAARIAPFHPAPQRAFVRPPRQQALPTAKSNIKALPTAKSNIKALPTAKSNIKALPTAKSNIQALPTAKSNIKVLPTAKSNIPVQPNAAVQSNALTQPTLRRNGTALVTPLAARKGRFASSFATAGVQGATNARLARVAPRRAWQRGLRAAFVPWSGPVFWPYAYSDVFDYAFWPGGYDDGYWAYAYDDFFDGVFWGQVGPPQEYVEDYAYAEPARRQATQPSYAAVQQLCRQPGTGITAWPIADIEKKVGLNAEQKQLLGEVKSAGQKAAAVFKASCPSENAFPLTPPGRLGAMTARLDATLEAVQTVRPALEKFYASLSDEQKERFNEIGPKQPKDSALASQASTQDSQSCKEQKPGLTNLPIEKVEDAVKPTDAQMGELNRLEEATAKAVSIMQAACPVDTPITPPGRLEAMEKRLQAMIDAANTVKPALNGFYGSLNAEQKARFNRLGREQAQTTGQSSQ